jgi:hypothetical protein
MRIGDVEHEDPDRAVGIRIIRAGQCDVEVSLLLLCGQMSGADQPRKHENAKTRKRKRTSLSWFRDFVVSCPTTEM